MKDINTLVEHLFSEEAKQRAIAKAAELGHTKEPAHIKIMEELRRYKEALKQGANAVSPFRQEYEKDQEKLYSLPPSERQHYNILMMHELRLDFEEAAHHAKDGTAARAYRELARMMNAQRAVKPAYGTKS